MLIVCGGIAAFKSAELARLLIRQGADVRVVLTASAQQFVTALTFQALTGNSVHTDLLNPEQEKAMGHINLARWADLLLVAPATANCLAKFSLGLADDLASTIYLAAECPVYLAPAMNQAMWNKPVTQENVNRLRRRGVKFIGPDTGVQACGEHGPGRMTEPEHICQTIMHEAVNGPLAGLSIMITAGPTREPVDPVRYLTNRSSGKMGFALAEAARDMGGQVTLVSGPVALPSPAGVELISVETAAQMHEAVMSRLVAQDIFIGAAAVADFSPVMVSKEKIKKSAADAEIRLAKTRDILADVAASQVRPFTVGFAAETDRLEEYALAKLNKKNLDMIAANLVGRDQGGFDSDQNALTIYWHKGQKKLAMTDKRLLAAQLLQLVVEKINEKRSAENS